MKKYSGTIMLLAVVFLLSLPVTAYSHELDNGETFQMFTASESKTCVKEELADYPVIGETITALAVESKTTEILLIGTEADTGFEVDIYVDNGVKEVSGRWPAYSGWT